MKHSLRKLTEAWLVAIFLLLPALTRAETAIQAWVQRYNGPGNGEDRASALAVDAANNVIVTGFAYGSGSYSDYTTIKYSSAGVPLWTNYYNGPGNSFDEVRAVVVDGSNDVVVTGYSCAIAGKNHDYATIKYSSAGVPLWTNRYNGPSNGDDQSVGVAVDSTNNVIVTGTSGGYYTTIEYSSAGDPLWTNRYHMAGASSMDACALAVDSSNNVVVTGSSGTFSNFTITYHYATIKYSGAGVPLWTNSYNGLGNTSDRPNALTVDGENNVIVTGTSFGGGGPSDYNYATVKYSSAGLPVWTNRYRGPDDNDDQAKAVAVDGSNNVIVTGYAWNGSSSDYATIKYSSAGVPLWTNRYNGPANRDDYAYALAVDGSGNVTVTGSSSSGTYPDYATIRYSSAGVPLWTNRYNGPGNSDDTTTGVVVDSSNNVTVTGTSASGASGSDFATIKYICVPSPVLTALPPTNGTFQLRVDDVLQPGTLVIEACANLAGWAPIFTNTTPTNILFYTDPEAGSLPTRFYRAFQSP
jgi:hypothetical protein